MMDNRKTKSWEEAVSWLLTQPDKQDLVRSCYYDQPAHVAAERYHKSEEWSAVRNLISRNAKGKALDIGAGNGIVSYALARDGWQVTALEPDMSDLVGIGAIRRLANGQGLEIETKQSFGEQIDCDDSGYELALARQVLHHAKDLHLLCRELYRVLKPGGVLVAIREHVISKKDDLEKFHDLHPLHHLYGGEHAYLLQEYLDALRTAGFSIRKIIKPLDSVINYAPMNRNDLRSALQKSLSRIPTGKYVSYTLKNDRILANALKLASIFDHRPGRLYSFVCEKPG